MTDFKMDIFQLPCFFGILLLFSQLTMIITTLIFCAKFLKPKQDDKGGVTPSMVSKGTTGPDGKVQGVPGPASVGSGATGTADGKKPGEAAAGTKPDDKKPGDSKKDVGATTKKNNLDQSKGKTSKEEEGGEGYENCNEMSPSQLQKIANEVK